MKFLHSKFHILNSHQTGFTLIEMLVVISVMALLSAILVIYNRSSERTLLLFIEEQKILNILNRAKFLSIQGYGLSSESGICAFGVHFDKNENSFILFKDLDTVSSDCTANDKKYTNTNEIFRECLSGDNKIKDECKITSPQAVQLRELGLSDIVFIPPDPTTLIDNDTNKSEAIITLKSIDGTSQRTIKVTKNGQITVE